MDYLHYHLRFKKLIFRYNQKPPRVSLDHVIYELIWVFDNNDNRHVTIAVRRIQKKSRKWLCLFKSATYLQSSPLRDIYRFFIILLPRTILTILCFRVIMRENQFSRFSLFCIFVRNGISVTVIVANITVEI